MINKDKSLRVSFKESRDFYFKKVRVFCRKNHYVISEFCRQAIREKLKREDQPKKKPKKVTFTGHRGKKIKKISFISYPKKYKK